MLGAEDKTESLEVSGRSPFPLFGFRRPKIVMESLRNPGWKEMGYHQESYRRGHFSFYFREVGRASVDAKVLVCIRRSVWSLHGCLKTHHTLFIEQELDGICYENNWILPTYRVSLLDGKSEGTVTVKGVDFEISVVGEPCDTPREARESAAAQMLAKLQSMATAAAGRF
ncbi:hypothetical protein CK203_094812 [Vitis vinifera]|uniref:Uncharacterized protein n=1 Tax=Vitis vinifera TaxID=29760 RepID=A0A438CZG5_VITVI|nr:hypothetical protein CK203_094812 [Vitis vinifera]